MSLPYMPFYWGDYWRDTAHLSDAEHVSYLRLISHYWQHGALPTDDERLARIAGRNTVEWMLMRPVISSFFQIDWRHKRVDRDLDRQHLAHEARVKGGKITAAKRWGDASSNAQSNSSSNSSANSSPTRTASSNQNHNHNHTHILESESDKIVRSSSRGTRLPLDWNPRPEDGEDQKELEKFRDYWTAVSGQKGVKRDWDATWRNWLRNAKHWNGASKPKQSAPETFRVGHPKGIVKFEAERPPLSDEQKREREEFVKKTLQNFGR
jgi:uncharacterized protein YdaU (DUF1376 family)